MWEFVETNAGFTEEKGNKRRLETVAGRAGFRRVFARQASKFRKTVYEENATGLPL